PTLTHCHAEKAQPSSSFVPPLFHNLLNYNLKSKVRLHPLVLFQIIDAYERRPQDANQVIGTLLGRNDKCGRIEITNSFGLVHKEHAGECKVDMDVQYATDMYELNQLTYPQEKIIGWYSTGKLVSPSAVAIHDYYTRECDEPVLLLVDTTLRGGRFNTRLYCAVEIGVPGGTKGIMFSLLPLEYSCTSKEWVALKFMQKHSQQPSKYGRMLPELVHVVDASRELQHKLDFVLRYINDVLARKRRPDNVVGRALHDALTSVPLMDSENFKLMFNANVRDMLMSITMAMLSKNQLQISEKLSYMRDY
ncbi:eukaryotic translation initiation factor 3 subunit F-2, partial [Scaptodrosophila lebanonensis]|uniref:Eukaryotic translation initiation factor 3 subunit F n=1 Tax=Drosophila lebanonensis TaxID=7225 RepID=A0A6J2THV8_DROLE